MSLLRRLFRRREAMDGWRSGLERPRAPAPERAPDAEPEDVPYTGRTGFDGRELKPERGAITGLEGGSSGGPKPPFPTN